MTLTWLVLRFDNTGLRLVLRKRRITVIAFNTGLVSLLCGNASSYSSDSALRNWGLYSSVKLATLKSQLEFLLKGLGQVVLCLDYRASFCSSFRFL